MRSFKDVKHIVNSAARQGLSQNNELSMGKKSCRVTRLDARRKAANKVLSVVETTITEGCPVLALKLEAVEDGLTS